MTIRDRYSRRQWIMIGVAILLVVLLIFRKQIWESKLGKAKMGIFETLITDPPEEAKENIKEIIDTLFTKE